MKVKVIESAKVKERFPRLMEDPRDGQVYLVLKRSSKDTVSAVVLKVGVTRTHLVRVGEVIEELYSKNLEEFKEKIFLENI